MSTHSEREAREIALKYQSLIFGKDFQLEKDIAIALEVAESRGFERAKEKMSKIITEAYKSKFTPRPEGYVEWRYKRDLDEAIKELTPE